MLAYEHRVGAEAPPRMRRGRRDSSTSSQSVEVLRCQDSPHSCHRNSSLDDSQRSRSPLDEIVPFGQLPWYADVRRAKSSNSKPLRRKSAV